jgi:hypothetical protein
VRPKNWLLPLSLGLSDGILNALVLASSTVVHGGATLRVGLAVRVGLVGLVTGAFTVFVAQYTSFRSRLARSERQLNFTRSGRLLGSELGRAAACEAAEDAAVAGLSSFAGSFGPLLLGASLPAYHWLALVVAVCGLGVLGGTLARAVGGLPLRWASVSMVCGASIAGLGMELRIA